MPLVPAPPAALFPSIEAAVTEVECAAGGRDTAARCQRPAGAIAALFWTITLSSVRFPTLRMPPPTALLVPHRHRPSGASADFQILKRYVGIAENLEHSVQGDLIDE